MRPNLGSPLPTPLAVSRAQRITAGLPARLLVQLLAVVAAGCLVLFAPA